MINPLTNHGSPHHTQALRLILSNSCQKQFQFPNPKTNSLKRIELSAWIESASNGHPVDSFDDPLVRRSLYNAAHPLCKERMGVVFCILGGRYFGWGRLFFYGLVELWGMDLGI